MKVHTSERGAFKRCRQYWDFTSPNRMNLEPDRPAKPLWFGIGIHEALAEYYDPASPRDGLLAERAFLNYCEREYSRYVTEEGVILDEFDQEHKAMTQLGLDMLEHYFEWCPKRDNFEVVSVEKEYEIALPGHEHIKYSFRLDGLVRDDVGRYWILEHKTAASIMPAREWLALDEQCGSYIWGTQIAEGIQIEGVIYNTLRKKADNGLRILQSGYPSTAVNQDTTYKRAIRTLREYYGPSVPGAYRAVLTALKVKETPNGNSFFHRDTVRRSPTEIENLQDQIINESLDMFSDPYINRHASAWNCQGCPFMRPCIAKWEGRDYKYMLTNLFRPRKSYDPTKVAQS